MRKCCNTCPLTVTADELWKGALAETGAGARKGRGKRTKKKRRKDLNRGQIIGEGEPIKTAAVPPKVFSFLSAKCYRCVINGKRQNISNEGH